MACLYDPRWVTGDTMDPPIEDDARGTRRDKDMSDENESADQETSDDGGDDFESMLAEHLGLDDDGDSADEAEPDSAIDDEDEASDDGSSSEEDVEKPRSDDRQGRIVQRLQASQARVVELERELRELKTAGKGVTTQGPFRSSGDLLDDLVGMAKVQLGIKDDSDPKLRDALWDLGGDLLAELSSDSDDPQVRSRLDRRAQQRKERAIQAQIDELKQRNESSIREANEAHGIAQMTKHLSDTKAETEYPYLFAAEDDVPRTVLAGIQTLIEAGHRVDDSNVEDTISFVLERIDSEHRARFDRLEKLRGKDGKDRRTQHTQGEQKARTKTETHGAQRNGRSDRKERKGGRTVTASGVGQRVAKRPDGDGLTGDELFESMLRDEIQARKRHGRR